MIHYVALAFVRIDSGLAPGEAVVCRFPGVAIRRAQAMSSHEANAGAVAFARQEMSDVGACGDAVILKKFGEVPEDFDIA